MRWLCGKPRQSEPLVRCGGRVVSINRGVAAVKRGLTGAVTASIWRRPRMRRSNNRTVVQACNRGGGMREL